MNAPLITVLITTYNYGRFIEQAIDSVLAQKFPQEQVEIVVIDDGSTDDTAERVKKYGSRIRYVYQANGGQAAALNAGFAKARGEIVALLDADDWFVPEKLARVAEAFASDASVGMVYHRFEEWHMQSGERQEWYFLAVSGDLHREPKKFESYVTPPTSVIAFRRSALDRLLPIPEQIRMLADCYIAALVPFVAPVVAIPEVLAIYRIHGENSYYARDGQAAIEMRKSRVRTWQVVVAAMNKWLAEKGYTRKLGPVRSLQDHWKIILAREEFAVRAPGRVRFFGYLLQCYRRDFPLMSWKLRLINGFNAVGSLVVGYESFPRLDKYRESVAGKVHGLLRRDSP
jgi:glycosyltransferase involved in cell wall biosynthesis